jgi:hypothetical protein
MLFIQFLIDLLNQMILNKEDLLLKNYFILTSTRRTIGFYAKILPTNQTERDVIYNKLHNYILFSLQTHFL